MFTCRAALFGWIFAAAAANFTVDVLGDARTDGTLGGDPQAFTDKHFEVKASVGQSAGPNLYHSFDYFHIRPGGSATFTGPNDIGSVITRVTGHLSGTLEPSKIDGLLKSDILGADFWFINPAGVMFGSGARIEVSGAFHASTASEVRFPDGLDFSAVNPGGPNTLSVEPPEAFGFLDEDPAGITLNENAVLGCGLDPQCNGHAGEVSIIAGPIDMSDAKILPEEMGVVRVVGIAEAGEVGITPTGVDVNDITAFSDIYMISPTGSGIMEVAVDGSGAGRIVIRGKDLRLRNSFIRTKNTGVTDADDQGIDIELTGRLQMDDAQILSPTVNVGNAAPIVVRAAGIEMENNSPVSADSFEDDDASPVTALGDAGNILLDGGNQLVLISGAQTEVTSKANENGSGIAGNAGHITIRAGEFRLLQGAQLGTTNFSRQGGDAELSAGDVTIVADTILIDGDIDSVPTDNGEPVVTAVFADVDDVDTEARGGNVRLMAREDITVTDGGQIQVRTNGKGDSGTISLEAAGVIRVDDQAELISESTQSRGGDVDLKEARSIVLENSEVNAVVLGGDKQGGNVTIAAKRDVTIRGTTITTRSGGSGNAGNVKFEAGRLIDITDSRVETESDSSQGGNITLTAPFIIELFKSQITSSVFGPTGTQGGNILFDPQFVILNNSDVLAEASEGRGGLIQINADYLIRSADSNISAKSPFGIDGTVLVLATELDLEKGLLELPVVFVDAASQVPRSCEARSIIGENKLNVAGRDGLPPNPAGLVPAFYALSLDSEGVANRAGGEQATNGDVKAVLWAPMAIDCN